MDEESKRSIGERQDAKEDIANPKVYINGINAKSLLWEIESKKNRYKGKA